MLTVQIHINAVDKDNAPVLISPGSHKLEMIAEADILTVVDEHGSFKCLAGAGDVWVYSTLIVHASDRACF